MLIPDAIIKSCITYIAEPLTDICNNSFISGTFPQIFKTARVCPIHKKGNKNNIQNYRPISLLSGFSKIMEKIMDNRLISFLEKHKILSNEQFGFQKRKSTAEVVSKFVENILHAKDMKEHALGLFIDLAKAFDMVDHSILFLKN